MDTGWYPYPHRPKLSVHTVTARHCPTSYKVTPTNVNRSVTAKPAGNPVQGGHRCTVILSLFIIDQ